MANNRGGPPSVIKNRGAKPAAAAVVAARVPKTATPDAPRKRVGPAQFFREVQAEARKITWTSWKETWITSIMVFIMVVLTAIFFLLIDNILGQGMQFLLKLGT